MTIKLLHQLKTDLTILMLKASQDECQKVLAYLQLIKKWNQSYNLTAIKSLTEMYSLHLLDSLAIAPYITENNVADIGTGAGLPGIILAIYYPNKSFTLVDSVRKKTLFLAHVKRQLDLHNVTIINERVEVFKPDILFDQVISRAFTQLNNFYHSCQHLLKPNGQFLAMKSHLSKDELSEFSQPFKSIKLSIPGLQAKRQLVCF